MNDPQRSHEADGLLAAVKGIWAFAKDLMSKWTAIKEAKETYLLTIEVPGPQMARLREMMEQCGASRPIGVVVNALAVYDLLLQERQKGASVVLRYPDGTEQAVSYR